MNTNVASSCWTLLLCMSILCWIASSSIDINIAAFNMRVFGISRMESQAAPPIYSQIIRRYDLILLQEIRDASQTAIYELLDIVNSDSTDERYLMALSNRTGRTTSKEQYAYMYKESKLEVVDAYDYDDINDVFEREPYVALFRSRENTQEQWIMIGIHTKPLEGYTKYELDNLTSVYDDAVAKWQVQKGMLLGDFNADCDYVEADEWDQISLWTDTRFSWMISNDIDSTVKTTDCAYDRIVVTEVDKWIVPDSAVLFRFDLAYNLNQTFTEYISDHYVVEIKIQLDEEAVSSSSHLSPIFV